MQVYVMPLAGGEATKLTDLKEDAQQVEWSPDGKRLVFASRVPDQTDQEKDDKKRAPRRITRLQYKLDNDGWTIGRRRHIFVVPADSSSDPRQITDGDFEDGQAAWSPDGRRIAFVSSRHQDWDLDTSQDIFVVDAAGSSETRLVTATDGTCCRPAWSPDGTRIAYNLFPAVMDDPRHTQIAVLALESGERKILTESLDRTCAPNFEGIRHPVWEADNRLVFCIEDSGNNLLYRVPADGSSEPEVAEPSDCMILGYDSVGGSIVTVRTRPTALPELYAGDRRLTEVGGAFAERVELAGPERFTAISPDGSEVEAWVVRPTGFEEGTRYPTLLNIHGGPFTQYGNKFFDEFQVYAGAGYAVVYSNPRGSSGYSEAWGRAIRGPGEAGPGWGSVDYEDVIAVLDAAIKRFDFIDPDRLGVMGGSYGGYLTSWIVGHTDRFQAAISERSVNQFVSEWGSSDYGWALRETVGTNLWEDFDAYVKVSPAMYAKDITTPLLILHSEEDLRCPVEQAEQLFVTLRLLKRDVELVRFPSEGHELTRSGSPVHRVMRFEIVLDWLARYLEP